MIQARRYFGAEDHEAMLLALETAIVNFGGILINFVEDWDMEIIYNIDPDADERLTQYLMSAEYQVTIRSLRNHYCPNPYGSNLIIADDFLMVDGVYFEVD